MAESASLNAFLARSHASILAAAAGASEQPVHVVLGNEAADPDSCVCAIALAAALDAGAERPLVAAPLIAVPRSDFKLQLDRVHLLRRAGLANHGTSPDFAPAHVCFADELDLSPLAARGLLRLHLVDHNKLAPALAHLAPCVASIIDHHAEEGLYTEGAPSGTASRHVELGVGSCASLVAERVRALAPSVLDDPATATLLLGAVLLDTVNLDPSKKPQKPREVGVADALLATAAAQLGVAPSPAGRDAFFAELLRVKADTQQLLQFSTCDLLRMDYKEEAVPCPSARGSLAPVGVGSVVLPLPLLLARQPAARLQDECAAYAVARGLRLLLLMSCDLGSSPPRRYLLMHCDEPALRATVLEKLRAADLRLTPLALDGEGGEGQGGDSLLAFTQDNYGLSRKVLMPVLRSLDAP